jgi:hypothetical protein
MKNKEDFEKFVESTGNQNWWTPVPHIGGDGGILPSVRHAGEGYLSAYPLSTFVEEVSRVKSAVVFVHPNPANDDPIWEGFVRYKIMVKK